MKWLYALCAAAFVWIVFNQLTRDRAPPPERQTSVDELIAYARNELEQLQDQSIARNQELCGVIFEDAQGALHTSKVYAGGRAACALDWGVPLGNHVVASFHTHGAHDSAFDSEVPSIIDMATDIDARIDGFISTPGGRLWHVRWQDEAAVQVCGEGCLQQDPAYRKGSGLAVPMQLTLEDISAREEVTIR